VVSAAPTVISLETSSAWIVILAVSLVTLPLSLFLRRLLRRVDGFGSSLLLLLPLGLPLIAAVAFHSGVLPEIAVLKPAGRALLDNPSGGGLLNLLLFPGSRSEVIVPYALSGSTGPWLLLFGLTAVSFMLTRRFLGFIATRRLIRRAQPLEEPQALEMVASLSTSAGLRRPPPVLILPSGYSGAFALGAFKAKILVSSDLIEGLETAELEGILAHEIAHIASHDIQVVLLAGLFRDVVAWNPLGHVAYRKLTADREFDADRRAASLTGKPLALASSLLKACELLRASKSLGRRSAVALLRRKGRLSIRVNRLIALADGPVSGPRDGYLPYLAAACLAAALGLQAGATIAQQGDGAFAIVLGAPDTSEFDVWKQPDQTLPNPRLRPRSLTGTRGSTKPAKAEGRAPTLKPAGIPYPEFSGEVAVKVQDLRGFIGALNAEAKADGLAARALSSEINQRYFAVPLLEPALGSVGIYRIEVLSGRGKPLPH
jgi:heat shock protein HtpX